MSNNQLITSEAVGSLKNLVVLRIGTNKNIRREDVLSLSLLKNLYVDDDSQLTALDFPSNKDFDIYQS